MSTRYDLRITPTSQPTEAIALSAESARRGDAAAFAWGGDGTVREVVEGLLGSATALGVLPGGTVNVVALSLGLSKNPERAAAALVNAIPQLRDVGLIGTTPFLMQATAGLDGFVMHEVRAEMKAVYGFCGMVFDGFRAFLKHRFEPFTVLVDGAPYEVTGAGFVNMAEYAGPYSYVPGARWDDGKAHVLLYTGRSHLAAFMFAMSIGFGVHHRRQDVRILDAETMTIRAQSNLFLQIDGDPWRGPLPVTCRLSPSKINVLIPASRDLAPRRQ